MQTGLLSLSQTNLRLLLQIDQYSVYKQTQTKYQKGKKVEYSWREDEVNVKVDMGSWGLKNYWRAKKRVGGVSAHEHP